MMDKAAYKAALAALGWSHADAAKHLCVSRSASTAWASGGRAVSATIERLLALYVNVPGTLTYIKALGAPSVVNPTAASSAKSKKALKVWTQAECMAEATYRAWEEAVGQIYSYFEDQGVNDEAERLRLAKSHARVTPDRIEYHYIRSCDWRKVSPEPRPSQEEVAPHLAKWFGQTK